METHFSSCKLSNWLSAWYSIYLRFLDYYWTFAHFRNRIYRQYTICCEFTQQQCIGRYSVELFIVSRLVLCDVGCADFLYNTATIAKVYLCGWMSFSGLNWRSAKTVDRLLSIWTWTIFYAHRLLRLLPSYAIVFALVYVWLSDVGDGPMWIKPIFGSRCTSDDWWRHLGMMSNYYPSECLPWMWYLAIDTQFYLVLFWFYLRFNGVRV
jgi:hypothetical protein